MAKLLKNKIKLNVSLKNSKFKPKTPKPAEINERNDRYINYMYMN